LKCLVSGATGFIGRQLCQQLRARGDTVIALSKQGASLDGREPTVALDLSLDDPDTDLLRTVDVFFHLAAIAHRQAGESDYDSLNYQATVRLARLASDAGVRCFIFLSSVKAMGPPISEVVRAECACTTPIDAYGRSKWQAERALREQFASDPMSVVIVRPALVYGENVKGNLQMLANAVRRGLPRPPAGGRRSMVALEDLVELLCVIAQAPLPTGVHTWIACSSDSYSTQGIYDMLRAVGGRDKGRAWCPRWIWRIGARLLDIASNNRGEATYDKLFGTELYSNAAVLEDTKWRPRTSLADVIEHIAMVGDSRS
jgi:nucleoside-diphosphate-sugar epimerase